MIKTVLSIIMMVEIMYIGFSLRTDDNNQINNNIVNEVENNLNEVENNLNEENCTLTNTYDDYALKPIIYLYPEKETKLTVKLGKPENITCSYPKYENEWNVTAQTDSTLIDNNTGRELYSLYWEGENSIEFNTEDGFVVKGEDTAEFLEEKLKILGLTEREAEEFIIFWLPQLQDNNYNYIRFATIDEINENMPLEFSESPDTLIRVFMLYKPLDNYENIPEQQLESVERAGFVAVEWGGTKLDI